MFYTFTQTVLEQCAVCFPMTSHFDMGCCSFLVFLNLCLAHYIRKEIRMQLASVYSLLMCEFNFTFLS